MKTTIKSDDLINKNHIVDVFKSKKIFVDPKMFSNTISIKTLKNMDHSIQNFKNGKVSKAIELSNFNQFDNK